MTPRAKSILFHLIMLAIPVVVAAAALAVYGWTVSRPYVDYQVRYTGDADIEFDREIGFLRPPHATTRRVQGDVDYTIHTDARGARVDAPGDETPPRVELLTVGCSFSEGHGFANEATFTDVVGRELGIATANFAVGSYSGVQAALSLERHADLRPKVIVYGLIEDHLRRNLDPCALNFFPTCLQVPTVDGFDDGALRFTTLDATGFGGVALTNDLLQLPHDPTPLRRVTLGLRTAWHEYRDWRVPAVVAAMSRLNEPNRVAGERYVLQRMAARAEAIGATLVVLHMGRLDGRAANDPFDGWRPLPDAIRDGLPAGVVFIDTADAVAEHQRRHPDRPLYLSRRDLHPSAEAHALSARLIADAIRERGLLD